MQVITEDIGVNNFLYMYIHIIIYVLLTLGYTLGQVASYCDYESGFTTNSSHPNYYNYTIGNHQEKCNSRMLRSLDVLNANYIHADIEFVLHPDYQDMLHATDPGFDGFYENATGGNSETPSADAIKTHYNIPNALNIYIIDYLEKRDGLNGMSTYPWSLNNNKPGVFIKHGFSPGDVLFDARKEAEYDKTLMHEIGHYFGLLHINGIWYLKEGNRKRDLVYGDEEECLLNGDTICDTPPEPGMSNTAWHENPANRECIYHGYGGKYDSNENTLQIGGHNQTYFSGYYPFYDYCEEWEIDGYPYGFDHCQLFCEWERSDRRIPTRGVGNPRKDRVMQGPKRVTRHHARTMKLDIDEQFKHINEKDENGKRVYYCKLCDKRLLPEEARRRGLNNNIGKKQKIPKFVKDHLIGRAHIQSLVHQTKEAHAWS